MLRIALVLTALVLAGCASSSAPLATVGSDPLEHPPRGFRGFPPQSLHGIVFASAHMAPDHEDVFEFNFERKADILPIAVTVLLRGQGQDEAQVLLNPERWNPQLFLEDGTALRALSVDEVIEAAPERVAARIRQKAMRGGLVSARAEERYLFFRLSPGENLQLDDQRVHHMVEGGTRVLELGDSLLAMQVTVEGELIPFYLGIQP